MTEHLLVPEILAPAGGREQFFAALNAGADAVFLGLKSFNARARAENFSVEDLLELVPLAHRYGMKVLVTVNVLIKEAELTQLVDLLGDLEAAEVDAIIGWLTGYTPKGLEKLLKAKTNFETFFTKAPKLNPKRKAITGLICGIRVEVITDPLMQELRYLDKLVDELAKGKPMEKIFREG